MKKKKPESSAQAGELAECDLIINDKLYRISHSLCKEIQSKVEKFAPPKKIKFIIRKTREWSEDELALLGKVTDRTVAEQTGLSVSAVATKRKELSIDPCRSRDSRWRRIWSKEEIALLGKMPDNKIAKKLSLSNASVSIKRRELEIPRYSKDERIWSKEEIALLGEIPDRQVAVKLGVPNHIVYFKRKSLNISAHNRQNTEEERSIEVPELNSLERKLASEIYNIYDKSKSLILAVEKIKKFTKKQDKEKLKRVSAYLTSVYNDNFPLERCLTLVGIF